MFSKLLKACSPHHPASVRQAHSQNSARCQEGAAACSCFCWLWMHLLSQCRGALGSDPTAVVLGGMCFAVLDAHVEVDSPEARSLGHGPKEVLSERCSESSKNRSTFKGQLEMLESLSHELTKALVISSSLEVPKSPN